MRLLSTTLKVLADHPTIGAGGSIGGFWGSVIATAPLWKFLAAFFGSMIGLITLIGMICQFFGFNCREHYAKKRRKGRKKRNIHSR